MVLLVPPPHAQQQQQETQHAQQHGMCVLEDGLVDVWSTHMHNNVNPPLTAPPLPWSTHPLCQVLDNVDHVLTGDVADALVHSITTHAITWLQHTPHALHALHAPPTTTTHVHPIVHTLRPLVCHVHQRAAIDTAYTSTHEAQSTWEPLAHRIREMLVVIATGVSVRMSAGVSVGVNSQRVSMAQQMMGLLLQQCVVHPSMGVGGWQHTLQCMVDIAGWCCCGGNGGGDIDNHGYAAVRAVIPQVAKTIMMMSALHTPHKTSVTPSYTPAHALPALLACWHRLRVLCNFGQHTTAAHPYTGTPHEGRGGSQEDVLGIPTPHCGPVVWQVAAAVMLMDVGDDAAVMQVLGVLAAQGVGYCLADDSVVCVCGVCTIGVCIHGIHASILQQIPLQVKQRVLLCCTGR